MQTGLTTALDIGPNAASVSRLEHCQILEQRYNADNNHDYLDDLSRSAVYGQPLDEVKDQHDHEKCDQNAD